MRNYGQVCIISVLCFSGLITGQSYFQSDASQTELSDSQISTFKNLLPDAVLLSAKPLDEPSFYSQNLWDYIDGGAEAYHSQGFVALIHQNYLVNESEVTVDIYDMGTPVQAFGMYALERSPEYQFLKIGLEGHGDAYGLYFFQGQYYIRLSAFSEDDSQNLILMMKFAKIISKNIGSIGEWPAALSFFPENFRIAHSEQYIRTAPMGHPFLAPVYSVQYQSGDSVCTLILSEAGSEENAVHRADQLADHFKTFGHVDKQGQKWIGRSEYEGTVFFIPKGRYLVLLQSPFEGAQDLLEAVLQRIP